MSEVVGYLALIFNALLYLLGSVSFIAGLLFVRSIFRWQAR